MRASEETPRGVLIFREAGAEPSLTTFAIVGHQSDECGNGAVIGAAVFATGDLLHQIDQYNEKKKVEEAAEKVAKGDSLLDSMWSEP